MRVHEGSKSVKIIVLLALFMGLLLFTIGSAIAAGDLPAPRITSVQPDASAGTLVIFGTGFGTGGASSTVTLGEAVLPASSILSWSDTEITCEIPEGTGSGQVKVLVTAAGGVSDGFLFMVEDSVPAPQAIIISVTPNQAMQLSLVQLDIRLDTWPGSLMTPLVSLENEAGRFPIGIGSLSGDRITCPVFIYPSPGVYDVVVSLAVGEYRIVDAFTITSPCGAGSSSAVVMLGLSMGLLSLAGSGGILRRRRRKLR